MTVVAGMALLNSTLLAADCRVTFSRTVFNDSAQKLFLIVPGTAIGFAGNGRIASAMLQQALQAGPVRRRTDSFSISAWLPKLFRRTYPTLAHSRRPDDAVSFLVAFSERRRRSIAHAGVLHWALNFLAKESPTQPVQSWLTELMFAGTRGYFPMPSGPQSGLYVMHSPGFSPTFSSTPGYAVIGSGSGASRELQRALARILGESLGPAPDVQEALFRDALEEHMVRNTDPTMGGLIPMLRLEGHKSFCVGAATEIPVPGTKFQIAWEDGSWVQRDLSSGASVTLLPPWRLTRAQQRHSSFNPVVEAVRELRKKHPFWRSTHSLRASC